ncbi:MAG: ATP-binding protein [Clostridiales bacterium]|jgi:two-component system phosphate regulon sensor histidine kinase PhoR|uniref:HAMP domain-containing sensor histidine kinase n=1 Tax=Clostridia TaxID=186801 RepID=UPI0018AC282E|nr:HAMP domain-containing sensor histidine kinase [Clostridium sp. 1001270J_160509_D11]MDU1201377.1 ATP-binding protein [Clostridiales bacterium]
MNSNLQQVNGVYFFIMLITSALAILLIRYTVTLRRYLKEFTRVSKKVSNKEFHTRFNTYVKGELGELSKNFNYMIQIMDSTIEEVEYKHLQLTSIVKSISHGILAIDIKGNILLINDIAKEMLKCDLKTNVEGSNFKFIVKDKKILEIFHKYVGSTQNEVIELDLRDNLVYRIKIDPVYLQDSKHAIIGSIINIEDITDLVKLENMRRDFVANVSHELKTPLTSITGFVETLKINDEIDKATRNHFLDIIEKESNRLKGLIEDILMLSSIENGQDLSYEQVKLFDIFKEVCEITQYIASSKNIEVSYDFEDEEVHILGIRDNIKQIFLNLVDNGIKYTPENGRIQVIQYYDKDKQNIILEFKDNGIGIPKESLNRIFERFYRVDKARSRDIGGTGLGLAITKHMVKSLGGNIEVNSILGVGSDFIVTIPQNTE